jgi:Xaa-Pro aminopeptidase
MRCAGHTLKVIERNLVDEVWTDRPAPPSAAVFVHPIQYAGQACLLPPLPRALL